MKKLTVVYFGSPDFSARFLEEIIKDQDLPVAVKLAVTQPDRPVGRKQVLMPTPVKLVAEKYHLPIFTDQLNKNATGGATRGAPSSAQVNRALDGAVERQNLLRLLRTVDLCLVYAYGEIIPKELLSQPKFGFWNIHPSLLPLYRGASPIAYPLILGDKQTGVSLMLMDEKIDHGPLIAQEKLDILPTDKRPELEMKLTDLAFQIFKRLISTDLTGSSRSQPTAQADNLATYAPYFKRGDGFISLPILKKALNNEPVNFSDLPSFLKNYLTKYSINPDFLILNSSFLILNLYRGLSPWPGFYTILPNGKRLKIIKLTCTARSPLHIDRVQLEGKHEVDFKTFNRAYQIFL